MDVFGPRRRHGWIRVDVSSPASPLGVSGLGRIVVHRPLPLSGRYPSPAHPLPWTPTGGGRERSDRPRMPDMGPRWPRCSKRLQDHPQGCSRRPRGHPKEIPEISASIQKTHGLAASKLQDGSKLALIKATPLGISAGKLAVGTLAEGLGVAMAVRLPPLRVLVLVLAPLLYRRVRPCRPAPSSATPILFHLIIHLVLPSSHLRRLPPSPPRPRRARRRAGERREMTHR